MMSFKSLVIIIFSSIILAASSCSTDSNSRDIQTEKYLTIGEQAELKNSIIRYMGKLPGKGNNSSKFDTAFNKYYTDLAERHQVRYYFIDETSGFQYFLITRIAPSIAEKYVAIGGKIKYAADSKKIEHYEEVFRTWKMPMEELDPIAKMLFNKMIDGKDLSEYYPENSGDDYIIEFPNKDVTFNVEERKWDSKLVDVMEPYYKLKEQAQRDQKKYDSSRNDINE